MIRSKLTVNLIPSVAILLAFPLLSGTVVGQVEEERQLEEEWLTYENPEFGFSILYPTDMEVVEREIKESTRELINDPDSSYVPTIVTFQLPADGNDNGRYKSFFSVTLRALSQYLDTDDLEVKSKTAQDYAQEQLELLETQAIRSMPSTITEENYPAWRIDYAIRLGGEHYASSVFTVIGNKVFELSYNSDPLLVPETLPIAQTMIDSFKITE